MECMTDEDILMKNREGCMLSLLKHSDEEKAIENIVKASADNPNEFFELRKENEELNRDKTELVNSVTELEKE